MEEILSTGLTSGLLVIIVLAIIFFLYAFWQNTDVFLTLIPSLFIGTLLYRIFPYTDTLTLSFTGSLSQWSPLVLFTAFTIISYIFLERLFGGAHGSNTPLHVILTVTALMVLLITLSYNVDPTTILYDFGAPFNTIFASAESMFWSVIFAFIVLFML